jgi:Uma2 family endonuclease
MAIALRKLKQVPDRLLAALHRVGVNEAALRETYGLDRGSVARALANGAEPLRVEDMAWVPDDGHQYELWEGELVRMSPSKRRHAVSAGRLVRRLSVYLEQNPLGEISIAEGGFRAGPRQTLHCPDVGYTSNERAAQAPLDEFYPFAPDLAVEVWSPDNTEREMRQKAANYLEHGARLVWLLRPSDRTVRVHRPDTPVEMLRDGDQLAGEEVLPGFVVSVSDLFPEEPA